MAELSYECSFAGVPFLSDKGVSLPPAVAKHRKEGQEQHGQPGLMEEASRLMPFRQMNEMAMPTGALAGELGPISVKKSLGADDTQNVHVGEWFYPTTASRWSVFRGLMTSSMVKAILNATSGLKNPGQFKMESRPITPRDGDDTDYTISTQMHCLPPRCLGETAGSRDGIYLVTLVDDRWYFQGLPAAVTIGVLTTWDSLLQDVAGALGISLSYDAIPDAYGVPNPKMLCDLWKYGSVLLDVIAFNIGRIVVRKMDGAYTLEDADSSNAIVATNRGIASQVVRIAGGDMFTTGQSLPVGDLSPARNAIVPNSLVINFPQLLPTGICCTNPEDMYSVTVPITSGGLLVSGLTGVSQCSIFSAVNALYLVNSLASGTVPANASGLMSYALQTARDFYGQQVVGSIDETYPGTFNWEPEGVHDIIWTYSEDMRRASTRITRTEWNLAVRDLQGNSCPASNATTPFQTVRDSWSGYGGNTLPPEWFPVTTALSTAMSAGSTISVLSDQSYLPTQNRWRGQISSGQVDEEIVLFEGTSGGQNVGIVARGIDGTLASDHLSSSVVQEVPPHNTSGVTLTTYEKGQYVYTQEYSGDVQGIHVVPQTQTVLATPGVSGSIEGQTFGGYGLVEGRVVQYGPSGIVTLEPVFLLERNAFRAHHNKAYDGQLVGYSARTGSFGGTPTVLPIYAVTQDPPTTGIVTSGLSGGCNYSVQPVCWTGSGFALMSGSMTVQEANCTSGVQSGVIVQLNCIPDCFGDTSTCWFIYCCTTPPGSGPGGTSGPCVSGVGLGSGGCSGGGTLITTACCPSSYLSQNLTLTLGNVVNCSCLAGSYTLNGTDGITWTGTYSKCGTTVIITLACVNTAGISDWKLTITGCGDVATANPTKPIQCSPLLLTFPNLTFPRLCVCAAGAGPGTVSAVVTGP